MIQKVKDLFKCSKKNDSPSLGRIVIGTRSLQEISLISQGGYAYVYKVKDSLTKEVFALKKMICQNEERLETAKNEIKVLQLIPSHTNLLKYYDSLILQKPNGHYVYILMEYCSEGSLFDLMVKNEKLKLSEDLIIKLSLEICMGIRALHSVKPPIAHRDLKIENILLQDGVPKICDYGSCSQKIIDFSQVNQKEFGKYEEEYDRNTTLMYRPPEMCDPYQKWFVNEKVDVWMFGCIVYTLCFYRHPFQDEMSKLSIVNAAFKIPENNSISEKTKDLIRHMLTPNPVFRPSIEEIYNILEQYSSIEKIDINSEAQRIKNRDLIKVQENVRFYKKIEERKSKQKENDEAWLAFNESKTSNKLHHDAFEVFKDVTDQKVNQDWNTFSFKRKESKVDNFNANTWEEKNLEPKQFEQFDGGENLSLPQAQNENFQQTNNEEQKFKEELKIKQENQIILELQSKVEEQRKEESQIIGEQVKEEQQIKEQQEFKDEPISEKEVKLEVHFLDNNGNTDNEIPEEKPEETIPQHLGQQEKEKVN